MKRLLLPAALFLLAGGAARAQSAAELRIVSFSDSLLLRVGPDLLQLVPGSPAAAVPAGVRAEVLSGTAMLMAAGSRLQVRPGSAFTLLAGPEGPALSVEGGSVESVLSDGSLYPIPAGQTLRLGGRPPSPVPPPAPAPGGSEVSAAPPPSAAAEARAPGFDPLDSLARFFDGLSRLGKPQLKLVMDLHPYYRLEQAYQSNIYRVPRDGAGGARVGGGVRSSWITTNNAGLKFELPFDRRKRLTGAYDAQYVAYTTQPQANDAFKQLLRLEYAWNGARGVDAKVWDSLAGTVDPAFSETVARERRVQNDLGLRLDVARNRRFVWGLEGGMTAHKYRNPSLAATLDRREYLGGVEGGLLLQPKTKLYLAYKRGLIHYTAGRASHSRSHQASLGLSGRLAPKLNGKVEGSLLYRDYERSPGAGPRIVRNWGSAVQLDWQAGERTKATLRVNRDMNETTFSGNRYYIATGGRLELRRSWRRWSAGLFGGFEEGVYPEVSTVAGESRRRRDHLCSAGLSADWKLRSWLSSAASYTRSWRRSNFPSQYDYDDDLLALSLRVQF